MSTMQIVFLFDLNAFHNILLEPKEIFNKSLQNIRLACLRILTEFSDKTSNLRWGFKFFDSCGSVTQKMCKFSFPDLSLEAFETFESEMCLRYERHISYAQALLDSKQNNTSTFNDAKLDNNVENPQLAPIKILQLALNQILCEFQWECIDMWSPSSSKIKSSSLGFKKRNMLFLFGDFTDHDNQICKYFGLENISSKSKLSTTILPQSLKEHLLVKANIHWVWLNVSQDQTFLGNTSVILPILSEALHSIQGSLIPLSLMSQPLYNGKAQYSINSSVYKDFMLSNTNLQLSYNNSLLPFSSILYHSIHEPFYSNISSMNKSTSSLDCHGTVISIRLIKMLHSEMSEFNLDVTEERDISTKLKKPIANSVIWSKLIVQGALSSSTKYVAEDVLLCLPNSDKSNSPDVKSFIAINQTLYQKGINLVIICLTENGLQVPSLLSPLSKEAAIISILDPLVHFMNKPNIKEFDGDCLNYKDQQFDDTLLSIKNLKSFQSIKIDNNDATNAKRNIAACNLLPPHFQNQCNNVTVTSNREPCMKQFQMECTETWFKPTTSVSSLVSYIQTKQSNSNKKASFHKLLQLSVRNGNHIPDESCKENALQSLSVSESNAEKKKNENEEEFIVENLDQLLATSKDIYNSSLESSVSVLDSAKKIVRLVSNYYKKHRDSCFEENVQNFMKDNVFLTVRMISEKYETVQSEEDTDRKIKECQIQILLLLEIEALTLPPDKSVCVNSVTSLLRMMSFYSGALQLNRLLYETLRENYSNKLYDVLVDIGDELDMPIFEDADSSDSPDVMSSELMDEGLFGSTISSNMSTQSSSSACSRQGNRKLVRHRSDISDTIRRQVLLPGASPKKKKGKQATQGKNSAQKKGLRCSPRIAAKKNERQTRSKDEKSENVRRNLFPKEKASQTPKKHKCMHATTPRSKKKSTSKNKFVADTPSHKQNHSAFQRRKSLLKLESTHNLPKEIAESPKISKSAKSESNKEFLKLLQQRSSEAALKTSKTSSKSEAASLSFPRYTPESKKRLSLKLFSKLLTGPTARMGIKRCTKRLFDHVSPHKKYVKTHKPLEESKLVCTPSKDFNSVNVQEENSAIKHEIVPETSANKENKYEVSSKKSIDSINNPTTMLISQEIPESPNISSKAAGHAIKEKIDTLRRKSEGNTESSKESSLKNENSFSLPQYTPDSKKRLSLKLFSKFLTSPTARTGIKRCTKRLFDQVSPEKNYDNNKKHKPSEDCDTASFSKGASNDVKDTHIEDK